MLIQTSQSSHQRLLKRSFVLNMYIYIYMFHLHQGSRYGVKIHCRYLINRQGSCARNNGLRLVNVAGGRDIDRAIKPRGKSVACTRACSRRVSRCHDEQALLSCIGTSSTRAYGRSSGNLYCLRIRKSPWRLPILFTGFAATMESSKGGGGHPEVYFFAERGDLSPCPRLDAREQYHR